jgi:hypothetical protein
VDHGKAKPRSLADTFCGEEGLGGPRERRFIYSHPGVGHDERHIASRRVGSTFASSILGAKANAQCAPGRHGIPGIDGKVQDGLDATHASLLKAID